MLSKSGVFPPIVDLNLQSNLLTSKGCEELFQFIATTKISKINLGNNLMANDFGVWLSRHLKDQRI